MLSSLDDPEPLAPPILGGLIRTSPVKVDHAVLSAVAKRAESWSSSNLKDPKSLWSMETTGGMLLTHGPGGWQTILFVGGWDEPD